MRDRGIPQTTTGLQLIAEAYPDSVKALQYLADWYARGQMKEEARRHYEAGLAKLPGDSSLSAEEKVRRESEIRERVAALSQP
jgi:hypothetical protein